MGSPENKLLNRIISVLDCFGDSQPSRSIVEISDATALPYSTAGRLLQNLKSVGLINQDSKTKEYRLGPKMLSWATAYLSKLDLLELSKSYLQELQTCTNETISLYVLEQFERICVARIESKHPIRMVAEIGERMPLHLGAAGKIFLLQMTDEQRNDYYKAKSLDPTAISKLVHAYESIKKAGYSTSFGERVAEAASIAAPIYDFQNRIIAVINISGPVQRMDDNTITKFAKQILNSANELSCEFGYRRKGAVDEAL
ncbi:MAG: IclR family transcriptional regulator [Anaerolineaceae bacterium]|nr:IclR family transcriptional regulator [Anaerolineaceae bacterium]